MQIVSLKISKDTIQNRVKLNFVNDYKLFTSLNSNFFGFQVCFWIQNSICTDTLYVNVL